MDASEHKGFSVLTLLTKKLKGGYQFIKVERHMKRCDELSKEINDLTLGLNQRRRNGGVGGRGENCPLL